MSEPFNKEPFDLNEFDLMLKQALCARPEPVAAANLAKQAIHRARQLEMAEAVRRVRRWSGLFSTVAALLIIAVGAWVLHNRAAAGGFAAWSDATSTTLSSATSTASTSTTTAAEQWMWWGAGLSGAAIIGLLALRTLTDGEQWMPRYSDLGLA